MKRRRNQYTEIEPRRSDSTDKGETATVALLIAAGVAFVGAVIYFKSKGDNGNGDDPPPNGDDPPNGTTSVATQLATIWPFVSGGGTSATEWIIWVHRSGSNLMYDAPSSLDEIGYFKDGELVSLYMIQPTILQMPGGEIDLVIGWNDFDWIE